MKQLFFLLFLLMPFYCLAEPAYPYPIKYKQFDGSEITVILRGDEKVHWGETLDGYRLLRTSKNGWEYATVGEDGSLRVSGILAHDTNNRSASELSFLAKTSKDIRFSQKQILQLKSAWEWNIGSNKLIGTGSFFKSSEKTTSSSTDKTFRVFSPFGAKKLLMILIQFPDLPFTYKQTDFVGLMNASGYDQYGAHGSVKDYFLENSYGQFDLTTDVAPHIYTAAHNMDYYGADVTNSDGSVDYSPKALELMREAVLDADADGVDFSQYDNDNDGTVDGIYVVYAGYSQATGGPVGSIWGHAGSIIPSLVCDGKLVSKYSCSNELMGGTGTDLTTIGVICHEFGHVCGAPDYYDTDYETNGTFSGTGKWDVMCMGIYNGTPSGSQPAHMNPYEKVKAGWVTPVNLTGSTSLTIPDITSNKAIYTYNTSTADEYFIFENRQKKGFNASCPGHGLLIYRYSKAYWNSNTNAKHPQGFYLISANATVNPLANNQTALIDISAAYGNPNSATAPFPGINNKTSFTDSTIPGSLSFSGEKTGFPLTNITETNNTIKLCFNGCPVVNSPQNFTAKSTGASQIILSWISATNVIIARNTSDSFGSLTDGIAYLKGDHLSGGGDVVYSGISSFFSDSVLSPSSTYYYKIWATNGINYSTPSLAKAATTCVSVLATPFIEGFESGFAESWTQEYVNGNTAWEQKNAGINNNPSTAHSGVSLASFNNTVSWNAYVTKLITPPLDLGYGMNPVLKFWHTQQKWNFGQDVLKVYYRTSVSDSWKLLRTYTNSIDSWTMETIASPSSTYYIAFEGTTGVGYGICIDDIEVWKDNCESGNVWLGTTSEDWFTSSNWSCGAVPTLSTDVIIPSGVSKSPNIDQDGAVCRSITISDGATLSMNSTNPYTLTICKDWTNNGTFAQGVGKVSFQGQNALQLINGKSLTNFNVLEVKTGSINNVLEVISPIGLTADTSNLSLVSGTLKISSASTITPLTGSVFNIGSKCCFWNNGATINPTGKQCNLSGKFINSAGTSNFSFLLTTGSVNSVQIDGGSVNITGYFEPYAMATDIVNYTQTGGTLLINSASTSIPLVINSGSTFNMSGGDIIIQKASPLAICEYQNLATNYNVTGGTLQIGNTTTSGSPIIRINSIVPVYNFVVNASGNPTAKLSSDLTVNNTLTIGYGTNIDMNALTIYIKGDWINNGGALTATPTGTVKFTGTSIQNITGTSATVFNNARMCNTSGLILKRVNAIFNGIFTLVSGVITTGSNKVIIPATGTISRASGHVNGYLQKNIPVGASVNKKYEIGGNSEDQYRPVEITFSNVTSPGELIGSNISGNHPQIVFSNLDSRKNVNCYWSLKNSEVVFNTYKAKFTFAKNDLDSTVNISNLIVGRYDTANSFWEYPFVYMCDMEQKSLMLSGLPTFGDFQFAREHFFGAIIFTATNQTVSDNVVAFVNANNDIVVKNSDYQNGYNIKIFSGVGHLLHQQESYIPQTVIKCKLYSGLYIVSIETPTQVINRKIMVR